MAGSKKYKLAKGILPAVPYLNWYVWLTIILFFLVLPVFSIIYFSVTGTSLEWNHIKTNLLGSYFSNTVLLLTGTAIGTMFLGGISAVCVVFVDFPFKKHLEWVLVLPLSIPAYLLAFSYSDMLGYQGWLSKILATRLSIMNLWGAIFIFSLALFPYVYLPLKEFLRNQSPKLIEAGNSLGQSANVIGQKVLFPLCRPVLIGGIFLVSMEVLNDYGVVKYLGVPTFTAGIFRAWTGFGDITSALRLSCILLLLVFALMLLIKNQQHASPNAGAQKIKTVTVGKWKWISFGWVLLLCIIGFALPVMQMIYGTWLTYAKVLDHSFLLALGHSITLAFTTAFFVIITAILILFASKLNPANRLAKWSPRLAVLGYTIPGAVVAIGVLAPAIILDKFVYQFSGNTSLFLTQTLFVLIYGLVIRYLAVGYNNIKTGFLTLSPNLLDASRNLGASPLRSLIKVEVPLLKPYILAGFILVFVDVLKELPLTMILRPFNYDTLAIKAFNLASDELLREASNASLLIVIVGVIAIVLLNRIVKRYGASS